MVPRKLVRPRSHRLEVRFLTSPPTPKTPHYTSFPPSRSSTYPPPNHTEKKRYRPHLPTPSFYSINSHPLPMLLALKHQSLHGATKSLADSQAWMQEHMEKFDNWFYSVFERDNAASDGRGAHLGSVSLRHADGGPELLPPLPEVLKGAEEPGKGNMLSDAEVEKRAADLEGKTLNLRVLGYALFEHAQGRGVATEACRGLLEGYAAAIEDWRQSFEGREDGGKTLFYVEGGVDVENPGSQRVLGKVGFRTVGMKVEKERAWLNGGWRGPGWWITGRYL